MDLKKKLFVYRFDPDSQDQGTKNAPFSSPPPSAHVCRWWQRLKLCSPPFCVSLIHLQPLRGMENSSNYQAKPMDIFSSSPLYTNITPLPINASVSSPLSRQAVSDSLYWWTLLLYPCIVVWMICTPVFRLSPHIWAGGMMQVVQYMCWNQTIPRVCHLLRHTEVVCLDHHYICRLAVCRLYVLCSN